MVFIFTDFYFLYFNLKTSVTLQFHNSSLLKITHHSTLSISISL